MGAAFSTSTVHTRMRVLRLPSQVGGQWHSRTQPVRQWVQRKYSICMRPTKAFPWFARVLGAYLYLLEALPLEALPSPLSHFMRSSGQTQELILLISLSTIVVLSLNNRGQERRKFGAQPPGHAMVASAVAALNILPIILAVLFAVLDTKSKNCSNEGIRCERFAIILDRIGLASARLARLNLALSLLLIDSGESAWLRGFLSSRLGYQFRYYLGS